MNYRYDPRRQPNGYSYLGSIQIPPLAQPVILTDRSTGIKYLVSSNETVPSLDNLGHISINSDLSLTRREAAVTYEADSGPKMNGTYDEVTLIIRDGHLGLDIRPYAVGITDEDNQVIHTRKKSNKIMRTLYVKYESYLRYRLAWTEVI